MKTSVFKLKNNVLLAIVCFFPCFSLAAVVTSPERVVYDFYTAYLKGNSVESSVLLNKYVSSKLLKIIDDSTRCNYDSDDSISELELEMLCSLKHSCKEYKGNYLCDWYGVWVETDVNYFIKSQDTYPSWKTNISTFDVSQNGNHSLVNVVLGAGSEPVVKLNVSLQKDDDSWKIVSVTK